jgi:hypothetical protein
MRVLSSDGKELARVTGDQAMPQAAGNLKMCALQPGKVCAVGTSGPTWCALLEYADEKIKVNVFHEAPIIGPAENPKSRFSPTFVAPWNGVADNHRGVLVGRVSGASDAMTHPLQIDLETLSVRSPYAPSMVGNPRNFHILPNGEALNATGLVLYHCAAPGKQLPNGKPYRVLSQPGLQFFADQFLIYEKALFVPSWVWHRIDPVTLKTEPWKLDAPFYPKPYLPYGVSAHFGIVSWNFQTGQFYRATLEAPPPLKPSDVPSDDGDK